jgi:nitrogen fixation/metabolism regulation signal transduction histidine kinase
MSYNRFNLYLVIQAILIAFVPLTILFLFFKQNLILSSIGLSIIWILQIVYLIYYLQRINRDLTRFLFAFKHEDSTMLFKAKQNDSSFKALYTGFNNVLDSFQRIKLEKEKDYIFFQNAIEHVGIGILSFNENGNILLSNQAFKNLFNLFFIKDIEQLKVIEPGLPDTIRLMNNGKQELLKVLINNKLIHLLIRSTDFRLMNESVRIISFQDIKNEIEQSEMDAWQKLIRVLTHEIMNSVSPITLLSKSLINLFEKETENNMILELSEDQVKKLFRGLHTINKRSKGLSKFVEEYRNLTQLSKPNIQAISVSSIFQDIETLFREELSLKNIRLELSFTNQSTLFADKNLIEQVIINLIKNSIHASENSESPNIVLAHTYKRKQSIISVTDNGPGIPEEILDSIFIPFFTTRKDGSGIGLSLSRQIMRLHNGIISVESKEDEGAIFSLQF